MGKIETIEAMDEYGMIAINKECGHCNGHGRGI